MKRRPALLFLFYFLSVLSCGLLAAQPENRITIAPAERLLVLERITAIVIPRVDFEDVILGEALDFLRMRSAGFHPEPEKPFSVVLVDPDIGNRRIKNLRLKDANAHNLLNHCAALTGCVIYIGDNIIEFHSGDRLDTKRRTLPASKATDVARTIIIPRIDLNDTSLIEAVDLLNARIPEAIASQGKVRILLEPSADPKALVSEFQVRNISLAHAALLICLRTGHRLTGDPTTLRIVKPQSVR